MSNRSLRDLLRLALPFGTMLLTPEAGLSRQVQRVVSLRATFPALPDLRGGELVALSVRDALALDERLSLRAIIRRLSDIRIEAIAAVGPVDEAAIVEAVEADIALLELPPGADPRLVERDALVLFSSPELQIERRGAHLYNLLTQQVANNAGIEAMLHTVGQATGREIAFYDVGGALRSRWGEALGSFDLLDDGPWDLSQFQRNGHAAIVRTVGNGTPLGYLAVGGAGLDGWDTTAADQAAGALLLELTKQQAVQAVETRVSGDLLQSILSGAPPDMAVLQEKASALGYNLKRPHWALMLAPTNQRITLDTIRDRLDQELRREHRMAPHMVFDDAVLCLYPVDSRPEQLNDVAGDFPAKLLQTLSEALALDVGVSAITNTAAEWQRAYNEAKQALVIGRHLFGERNVTHYSDLRVYRLLFELRSLPALWSFYHDTLGTLVEYDRDHDGALLHTLEGFFDAHGNLSQAAEQLHVHRNTLLYRLRRIGKIARVDMECPEDTLALQLALKIHRVLSVREKTG